MCPTVHSCFLCCRFGSRTLAPSSDVTPWKAAITSTLLLLLPFLISCFHLITKMRSQLPQQAGLVVLILRRVLMTSTARRRYHCWTCTPASTTITTLAVTAAAAWWAPAMSISHHRLRNTPSLHWPTFSAARLLISDWAAHIGWKKVTRSDIKWWWWWWWTKWVT